MVAGHYSGQARQQREAAEVTEVKGVVFTSLTEMVEQKFFLEVSLCSLMGANEHK
jgi:hypothetical protein